MESEAFELPRAPLQTKYEPVGKQNEYLGKAEHASRMPMRRVHMITAATYGPS